MTTKDSAGQRMLTAAGIDAMPRRALMFTAALLATALTIAVVGLVLPAGLPAADSLHPLARLTLVAAVMAVAQFARLRLRVDSGSVSVTWGEAALIIGLYLAPAGWLPAATFVGAGLAWFVLSIFAERRTAIEVVHVAALLTIGVALATFVAAMLGDPFDTAPTPALAAAVAVAALTYLTTTGWLTALTLSLRHGLPISRSWMRAVRGKLLMFVGNVVVGLAVVAMLDHDPRWLLLLPPALWLLQQTYLHRLRACDERRAWLEYAQAAQTLNRLDEHEVAVAGVIAALRIFGAERVDLDVVRADGRHRRYRGDPSGTVVEGDAVDHRWDAAEDVLTQPLTVGATRVGELRVRLPRSVLPGPRDQAVLTAYGQALAAAVHDAATNRSLAALTSRSSYEAVHDPLTGLVNRPALLHQGDLALRRLDHDHPVALSVIDLDNFREVNETLGHAAGDELLKTMADRLRGLAHPGELLGRLDGDEFGLLVTALPAPEGPTALGDRPAPMPHAVRRARQIAEQLAVATEVSGVKMSPEVSIGVVVAEAGTADMAELLRRADVAMHRAKGGGGSVASYDVARDAASTDRLMLLAELREALAVEDQLVLALQPAVDLSTGAPTGVEALIRWHHPRRGKLNPADFIRTVEESDLLAPFTRYVIDKALSVAAGWARHGLAVPISVNLSAHSLLDPQLPVEVAELLRRHQVPARRLVLEITETVVMSELEVIDEVLGALRRLGVQLAVDDFGTGFSSLTFLTRVAVQELKVDRSFVTRMVESAEAAAIVRATVYLGRELGLRVVAEGVETAEQRAALAALGCAAAQGYHFFRPMPSDKVVTVLRSLLDSAQARVFPLRADGAS